jgi:hypothetical protein
MLRKIWFSVLVLVGIVVIGIVGLGLQSQEKKSTAIKEEKDFFPIGLVDVDNPKDFPEIAAAGFNVVQSYRFEGIPPWGWTDTEAIKYLDAAQKAGLKVQVGIPQEAVQNPDVADEQDLAVIQQRARAVKDHPALWGYQLYDEPENPGWRKFAIHPTNFNNAYHAIKQLDTVHPILTSAAGAIDDTYPYLGVDIMMLQYLMLPPGSYPAPWDKLENLREAHRSSFETLVSKHKPFVFTVQAYNLANDPTMWPGILKYNPEAVGRYPTREEMRFIAYSGIIRGAKGIFFVSYKFYDDDGKPLEDISREGNPKQWKAVSSVSAELKAMTPILLAPTQEVKKAGVTIPRKSPVEMMIKQHQGKTYLLTVNPSEDPVRLPIRLALDRFPNPKITLLPERQRIPVQRESGSFNAQWSPYDVRIFEIAPGKTP